MKALSTETKTMQGQNLRNKYSA